MLRVASLLLQMMALMVGAGLAIGLMANLIVTGATTATMAIPGLLIGGALAAAAAYGGFRTAARAADAITDIRYGPDPNGRGDAKPATRAGWRPQGRLAEYFRLADERNATQGERLDRLTRGVLR